MVRQSLDDNRIIISVFPFPIVKTYISIQDDMRRDITFMIHKILVMHGYNIFSLLMLKW